MKKIFLVSILVFSITNMFAQSKTDNISFTCAEFKGGYGVSSFGKGLSEKYKAGNFSTSSGGLASLTAYHKFKKINYLNFGIKFKSLGAVPAKGDNGDELFFNYCGSAVSVKYFLMDKNARNGIYLQTDYYFVTQFTQKYRNVPNSIYHHQFAIGSGFTAGAGYDLPIGKGNRMITIGLEYEADSRTGEVTGIGKKNFKSANFGVMIGLKF